MERFVPKVREARLPAEPARPSERSKLFVSEFSIPLDEFDQIGRRELWEGYVKVLIRRVLLMVKNVSRNRKTRIKFFRFKTPPSSLNRKVLVYDRDGVFAVLVARRCAHQTHRDRVSKVAEFSFQIEISEFDNFEKPKPEPKLPNKSIIPTR